MVITTWTGIILLKVNKLVSSSTPVSLIVSILALSFESFFNGSICTRTRVIVLSDVEMSRASSHLHVVLSGSLSERILLGRFSKIKRLVRRGIILSRISQDQGSSHF